MSTVSPYAEAIEVAKRIRWEIESDVIPGRSFSLGKTFLPAFRSSTNCRS